MSAQSPMNEECGIFLVNQRKEILMIHQADTHWRKWIIPTIDRYTPDRLEIKTAQILQETTGLYTDPQKLLYLGISKHRSRRQLFHGFYLSIETLLLQNSTQTFMEVPHFYCSKPQNIDAYRWISLDILINYLPHHQSDQVPLLLDYLVREQEKDLVSEKENLKPNSELVSNLVPNMVSNLEKQSKPKKGLNNRKHK